jgi:GT2 family glycosyltransferase
MISRKVIDDIGVLDEIFTPGAGEDTDYCIRAVRKGYTLAQVPIGTQVGNNGERLIGGFPLWHQAEATVHDLPDWKEIFARNGQILIDKYGQKVTKITTAPPPVTSIIPMIAVITPVYNDAAHIANAIRSVRTQSKEFKIKHFIYDDASTDKTVATIAEVPFNPQSMQVLCGNENHGQSYARNEAIKIALIQGFQYIAFLDSDDEWMPDHLSSSMQAMDYSMCDVVYSKPRWIDEYGKPVVFYGFGRPRKFIGKQLEANNFIWISGVMAKSECMKDNKFDSKLDGLEDWDMWYRLNKQGFKFFYNEDETFTYLARDSGQASKSNVKRELVRAKHGMKLQGTRLNIACGADYRPEYINSDLYPLKDCPIDDQVDAREIPYDDGTVDEIRALHVIEHFDFHEGNKVLAEWYRALRPGGKLILETPDLLATCKAFVEGDADFRILMYGQLFACPWIPGQTHKFMFYENQLKVQLGWAGFKSVTRIQPISNYVHPTTQHLFLAVEAIK